MSLQEPLPEETLGQRIAAQRQRLGLSLAQVAQRVGVTRETMAGWESGHAEPRANRLLTLAGVLEASVGWLLGGRSGCAPAAAPSTDIEQLRTQLTAARDLADNLASMLETLHERLGELEHRQKQR